MGADHVDQTEVALGHQNLFALVAGCPKKGPQFDPTDPRANFVQGVNTLEKPDRSGRIDYEAAYTYFRDSASLGGGPKADAMPPSTGQMNGERSAGSSAGAGRSSRARLGVIISTGSSRVAFGTTSCRPTSMRSMSVMPFTRASSR